MALSDVDAADARSASPVDFALARSAADATAVRRTACLGLPRRVAHSQQVAEVARGARRGSEAKCAIGPGPPGSRAARGKVRTRIGIHALAASNESVSEDKRTA